MGFAPTDLGVGSAPTQELPNVDLSQERLKEAIYYISRVQEATAQQERLVNTGKFKDTQRNNIKMALNMMLENYRLNDRVVDAAAFIPQAKLMQATAKGNEAIEVLQTAQEYFARDLKVTGITDEQRKFVLDAMQATRGKLDDFLAYLPSSAVEAARKQIEDENDANLREYAGDGAIINPIKLPWKK